MPANIQVSLRLLAIPAQSWMLHRSKNFRRPLPIPKSDRARRSLRSRRELMLAACGRRAGILPDRHPAANRAVQHLRRSLDALGGGVQRIRYRGLSLTRAAAAPLRAMFEPYVERLNWKARNAIYLAAMA